MKKKKQSSAQQDAKEEVALDMAVSDATIEPIAASAAQVSKRALKRRAKRMDKAQIGDVAAQKTSEEELGAAARSELPSSKSDIDSIFAAKRKVDSAEEPASASSNAKKSKTEGPNSGVRQAAPSKGSADDLFGDGDQWVDDGLGGVYNSEGWTGRRTDDNFRIFKAHLLKVGSGGGTPQCPFDCQCCF
eukprot:gnl/MRDRNA2_/MRDRNA2_99935_c0_seq1.p1 gnl/MRDRNA2_/MRDRNA2_99935_c0~~gnl/MRDRNA2_/MRDRNA2_99935_c0_seq1.p1  ORF type:complete len:189 (-),score=66.82 gnl/MRDRNA2_/MRDRNA2_99935_c0_seq1:150-716(-)